MLVWEKATRGADRRKSASLQVKRGVIAAVEEMRVAGQTQIYQKVATQFNIAIGNISRWIREKDRIVEAASAVDAATQLGIKAKRFSRKSYLRNAPWAASLRPLVMRVQAKIKELHKQRRSVSLKKVAQEVKRNLEYLSEVGHVVTIRGRPLRGSTTFAWRLLCAMGFRSRKRGKIRGTPVETLVRCQKKWLLLLRNVIIQPHGAPLAPPAPPPLRARLTRLPGKSYWRPVAPGDYGEYDPTQRFNVDQVPFNLDHSASRSYIHAGDAQAVVAGPRSGSKRFGTLQFCVRSDGSLPPLTLIFPGKGGVMKAEQHKYHKSVKVMFHPNAWLDGPGALQWAEEIFVPWWKEQHPEGRKFLMFQDNFKPQRRGEYVRALQEAGGQCAYGPANQTEIWQPIDAGHLGATIKSLAKIHFESWMEKPCDPKPATPFRPAMTKNYERWEAGDLTSSEKRILMTWIFGEVFENFRSDKYLHVRQQAFRQSGTHLTLSGVNDDCVLVEGCADFSPEPPGTPFDNKLYIDEAWTGSDNFMFVDEMPGGNEQVGPDSPSSKSSCSSKSNKSSSSSSSSAGGSSSSSSSGSSSDSGEDE